MLENCYSNLYQSEFYQKASNECTDRDEFERRFALANVLYTQGLRCLGFTGSDGKGNEPALMMVLRNSSVINQILISDESALELLKEADSYERETRPALFRCTAIHAAIFACDEHLKRLDKPPVLKKTFNS